VPQFPARLHINEDLKVAFFISEFNIQPPMQSTLARIILNWSVQNECKMIVSAAGILNSKQDKSKNNDAPVIPDEQQVFALSNTKSAAQVLKENDFIQLRNGWIGGIPATLLNEGSLLGMDVIVLMVNTILDVPDFRASALISNAVTKLVRGLHCDIASLMVEAQVIENKMKKVRDGHNDSFNIYK
jgi:uncharacterized protein